MKINVNWKRWPVFLVVSAGLLYITDSVWMTAGIFLLLFVADYVLADWWEMRQIKKKRQGETYCKDESSAPEEQS